MRQNWRNCRAAAIGVGPALEIAAELILCGGNGRPEILAAETRVRGNPATAVFTEPNTGSDLGALRTPRGTTTTGRSPGNT
jgi:alkylation response protein AidB-like acyl-CoA dehydrogenase